MEKTTLKTVTRKLNKTKLSKRRNTNKNKQKQNFKPTVPQRKQQMGLRNNRKSRRKLDRASMARINNSLSSYLRNVTVPEHAVNAKIPSYSPLPTVPIHMKTTIKFSVNAAGDAALLINPYYLADSANVNSWILINNNNALNVSTGAGAGNFLALSMQSRVTAATFTAYRLVSASLFIYPEVSALNAQGYIAGGVTTRTGQADSYAVAGGPYGPWTPYTATASIIDQLMFYQKAQVGGQAGIRAIYVPFDPSFEFFCGPNLGRVALMPGCDQFFWNYYITGAAANSNFVVEVYYNFELEPDQESVLQLVATPRLTNETEKPLIKEMMSHPTLMSQSSSNLLAEADYISEVFCNQGKPQLNKSFAESAIDFLSENSGSVLNMLGSLSAFF